MYNKKIERKKAYKCIRANYQHKVTNYEVVSKATSLSTPNLAKVFAMPFADRYT